MWATSEFQKERPVCGAIYRKPLMMDDELDALPVDVDLSALDRSLGFLSWFAVNASGFSSRASGKTISIRKSERNKASALVSQAEWDGVVSSRIREPVKLFRAGVGVVVLKSTGSVGRDGRERSETVWA